MRNYIVLLIASVILSACGGGSAGGGGNPSGLSIPVGTVSGTTFDGLISNANLSVYDFSAGTKGALLAQAVSDTAGQYSISLKVESRPILIEVTGGSYFEEAGAGFQIALNGKKLSALMNYTAGETIKTAVTTFTHLAAGLATYEIGKGTAVAAAIDDANGRVTAMVGFNILTTQPVQITDQINANSVLTPELKYGFLAGAISMWTYNHGPGSFVHTPPYTSIDFAQLLYQDISADGILDGFGLVSAGAKTQLAFGGTPLNADVYRLGIGLGLVQIASDKNNKTRLNGGALLNYAQTYVASTDLIFDIAAPATIAAPEVKIATPTDGLWGRGTVTVGATVKSEVGISQAEILVDDVVVSAATTNTATPTVQLDTTKLTDGAHTIVVSATDLGGVKSVATSKLNIDNTPPTTTTALLTVTTVLPPITLCEPLGALIACRQVPGGVSVSNSGISGVVTDAHSGVVNIVVVGTSDPVVIDTNGSWSISPLPSPGSTIRIRDMAGNCTDYTDSTNSSAWNTVVSGACP